MWQGGRSEEIFHFNQVGLDSMGREGKTRKRKKRKEKKENEINGKKGKWEVLFLVFSCLQEERRRRIEE